MTWDDGTTIARTRFGVLNWLCVAVRGLMVGSVVGFGLVIMMTVRLVERPLCGQARPVTPFITLAVCRISLVLLGIGLKVQGTPMKSGGAVVANHTSWLDIFALNACMRVCFVSKAEVAGWPGIGFLARATGTLFIQRDKKQASAQPRMLQDRLSAGHRLLFFPEGTSTDGMRVLPFKTTLFEAFFHPDMAPEAQVQPVTLVYHAPQGADRRFYGWWGDMDFGTHLIATLGAPRQGYVEVTFHTPLPVRDFAGRKALAKAAEKAVSGGHPAQQDPSDYA